MQNSNKALIVGVGAEQGLGGALAKHFASQGLQVIIAGRTQQKLDQIKSSIESEGGKAICVVCDVTSEESQLELFKQVDAIPGNLELAVYNAGNSTPGEVRNMSAEYFESAWRVLCFGGFIFGRECCNRMSAAGSGTLIYTGASASLRGKAGFAAFNSGKAAMRTFAQALAKEYASENVHVAHVIIDGGIAGDRQFERMSSPPDANALDKFISLDGLCTAYWQIHQQHHTAWTFELDLRTRHENW